jgi:hypothetical protein
MIGNRRNGIQLSDKLLANTSLVTSITRGIELMVDFPKIRLVVHATIMASLLLFTAVSSYLFLKNRDCFPIHTRAPFRSTFMLVSGFVVQSIVNNIAILNNYNMPCVLWAMCDFCLGLSLGYIAFFGRIVELGILYEAELSKIKFDENIRASRSGSFANDVVVPVALKLKNVFTKRAVLCGFVVYVVFNIPVIVSFMIFPSFSSLQYDEIFTLLLKDSFIRFKCSQSHKHIFAKSSQT